MLAQSNIFHPGAAFFKFQFAEHLCFYLLAADMKGKIGGCDSVRNGTEDKEFKARGEEKAQQSKGHSWSKEQVDIGLEDSSQVNRKGLFKMMLTWHLKWK